MAPDSLRTIVLATILTGVLAVPACSGSGATDPPTTAAGAPRFTTVAPSTLVAPPPTQAVSTTAVGANTTMVTTAPTAAMSAHTYFFPVQPPEVADYGPDHHDYPATDIFAPVSSSLVAVTSGVVEELSRRDEWDPAVDDPATRGGLYVSIIGDDLVRYYYSHLDEVASEIEAGIRVDAGQVIGSVGKSGNARDTPSHVHFGLSRPTFPGDWEIRRGEVPPHDYLRAWANGEDLSPLLPLP